MKKKSPISYEEEFRKWLQDNGVSGKGADASYMAYIRQAKGVTGDSVDAFLDNIMHEAIKQNMDLAKFASNKGEDDVKDSVSAIRKYWNFIRYRAGIYTEQ